MLITGENGTGKEVIAHELHRQSLRCNEVMVSVDTGSLSETLFESELFGHVKDAFTDAKEERDGKFEIAKGSTLFMDEIANLMLPLRAKLLAALQNREIVKVGSNKKIPIDIRLVCATDSHLPTLVRERKFREDLLYRINTIHIEVPPLRERTEDIPLPVDYFLDLYCAKYKKPLLKPDREVIEKMQRYSWPGNIRELQHGIEKAVILSDGSTLTSNGFFFSESPVRPVSVQTLEEMERQMIAASIRQNDGNLTAVAAQLGITRQTLYNKIKNIISEYAVPQRISPSGRVPGSVDRFFRCAVPACEDLIVVRPAACTRIVWTIFGILKLFNRILEKIACFFKAIENEDSTLLFCIFVTERENKKLHFLFILCIID